MVKPGEPEREETRRHYTALPLAQLLPALLRPAFKRRSPAGAAIMADWATIVGARLAWETEPRKLIRGVLTLACPGPVAMELQHLSTALIERINAYAGQRVVEKLKFVQEPLSVLPVRLPAVQNHAPELVQELPEGELNDALAGLRAAILSEKQR